MNYTEKNFLDLDGLSYYDELIKEYIPITHAYYNNGNFYSDSSLTNLITGEQKRLYIAINTKEFYEYNGNSYQKYGGTNIKISSTQPTDQNVGDIWLKLS